MNLKTNQNPKGKLFDIFRELRAANASTDNAMVSAMELTEKGPTEEQTNRFRGELQKMMPAGAVAWTNNSIEENAKKLIEEFKKDVNGRSTEIPLDQVDAEFRRTVNENGWPMDRMNVYKILNKIIITEKKDADTLNALKSNGDCTFLMLDNNFGQEGYTCPGNVCTIDHHEDYDEKDYKSAAPKVVEAIQTGEKGLLANHGGKKTVDGRLELVKEPFDIKEANAYLLTNKGNFDVDGLLCMYAALFPNSAKDMQSRIAKVTFFTDYEMFGKYDYAPGQPTALEKHSNDEILGFAIMSFVRAHGFGDVATGYRTIVYLLPWLLVQNEDTLKQLAQPYYDHILDVSKYLQGLTEQGTSHKFVTIGNVKVANNSYKACLVYADPKTNEQILKFEQLAFSIGKFVNGIDFFILVKKIPDGQIFVNVAPKWIPLDKRQKNSQLALTESMNGFLKSRHLGVTAAFREEILLGVVPQNMEQAAYDAYDAFKALITEGDVFGKTYLGISRITQKYTI